MQQVLGGWGNCPVETCHVTSPESLDALSETVSRGEQSDYIARGLGRAYGDSALNADRGVILTRRLNRLLAFDPQSGLLECESGVSFADLARVMVPRGWFFPTTPGTKFVTVGGAIAADVHGKNHHRDGTFGNFVRRLTLLTASGEVLACSPQENADVFWATVGGMGLTGVILTAQIALMKIETAYFDVSYQRTAHLDETLERFAATDHEYRYSVAWIDCLASGRSLGRSVLMLANDGRADQLPRRLAQRPLDVPARLPLSVPFQMPGFALNPWSVKAFNALFYAKNKDRSTLVDYNTFFYPLDGVQHWNRIYGRRGFIQYQALFPRETSRSGLVKLLEKIARSRGASFLAVLKTSGEAGPGMLSYLHAGHTLALDLPNTGADLRRLVRDLDRILLDEGGRLYAAKDALTSAEVFAAMYPRLDEFRQVKARIDPKMKFVSSQARRLGIVEAVCPKPFLSSAPIPALHDRFSTCSRHAAAG
ncbi:MAG: FAD-binding oxidoreductase [Rhodopirellula sp.]|nr:FAD-binding oxidoreductase [Rhodopirellula sp.]